MSKTITNTTWDRCRISSMLQLQQKESDRNTLKFLFCDILENDLGTGYDLIKSIPAYKVDELKVKLMAFSDAYKDLRETLNEIAKDSPKG